MFLALLILQIKPLTFDYSVPCLLPFGYLIENGSIEGVAMYHIPLPYSKIKNTCRIAYLCGLAGVILLIKVDYLSIIREILQGPNRPDICIRQAGL